MQFGTGLQLTTSPALRGWAGLAIFSLAIAGVFALLLAVSRIPGVEKIELWPLDFFNKGLVIHVVFSFIVWFLSVFGAILSIATVRLGGVSGLLEKMLLVAAYASTTMLFAPSFMNRGEATLNNYIPAITDPLYYGGLVVLGGSLGLMALRLLVALSNSQGRWREPFCFGALVAAFLYVLALAEFTITGISLSGENFSYEFNEALFWGGGHTLQYVNLALLFVALGTLLSLATGGRSLVFGRSASMAYLLLAATATAGIYITLSYAPDHELYWALCTHLQYGMALPSLLFGFSLLMAIISFRDTNGHLPWHQPAFLCLALSPFVFAVGGALGLFVDGADTRTPAHYHGVIAGINLSFMGLFYGLFLPLMGRELQPSRAVNAQVWMFGGGQLLASLGLFMAGGYGTPRKIAGGAQNLSDMGAIIGMYLNGIGALIAISGGVMFIWVIARAILRSTQKSVSVS
jgi:cytochrome c oxidase subunit 1